MMKLMNGKLVVDLAAFVPEEMNTQEFRNQFQSYIQASLKLIMPDGSERELEIGEIISEDVQAYDMETGVIIQVADADLTI
ncbi:hypothetical protein [Mesobacillus foraminis]|uniref:Uncharacterized protein n=1 Tax=Mesobacillus foraminis TaxID=279826 RepID=A0A4R2BEX4_9BACI|nr:hypothetical protein [Mesobacillus foraminis]TCN25508.1 hypothetical protein EV146_105165 [Mesobacillus foraminis]